MSSFLLVAAHAVAQQDEEMVEMPQRALPAKPGKLTSRRKLQFLGKLVHTPDMPHVFYTHTATVARGVQPKSSVRLHTAGVPLFGPLHQRKEAFRDLGEEITNILKIQHAEAIASNVGGWRPWPLGWRLSLVGWRPLLVDSTCRGWLMLAWIHCF